LSRFWLRQLAFEGGGVSGMARRYSLDCWIVGLRHEHFGTDFSGQVSENRGYSEESLCRRVVSAEQL